jgi:seryl-tRNA synthetase
MFTPKVQQFSKMAPNKKEIEKSQSKLKEAIPPLKKIIADIEGRQKECQSRLDNFTNEENNLTKQLQAALAEKSGVKEAKDLLEKAKQSKQDSFDELEGLREVLAAKNRELAYIQQQIREHSFKIALANLYPLYDEYNEKAAVLAETIKKIYFSLHKAGVLARNCNAEFIPHVNFYLENGVPNELPAILADSAPVSTTEKYFWHYVIFNQEFVKTLSEQVEEFSA